VFSWTIVWTLVATTLQIALGLFLAVLVNDHRVKFKKTIRTILILPWAVPAFVSILIFAAMFNNEYGTINRDIIIRLFGVDGIPWLISALFLRFLLIMIHTLLGYPFLFAGCSRVLQRSSMDRYEGAGVGGASKLHPFRKKRLPHIL